MRFKHSWPSISSVCSIRERVLPEPLTAAESTKPSSQSSPSDRQRFRQSRMLRLATVRALRRALEAVGMACRLVRLEIGVFPAVAAA